MTVPLEMKTILNTIKYLLITVLGMLFLIAILGLFHRWTNPGMKSISDLDLKQLGLAITVNVILLALTIYSSRQIKK